MRLLVGSVMVIGGMALFWHLTDDLDPQASAMAVGILVGVLSTIPTALILLVSQRRQDEARERFREHHTHYYAVIPPRTGPGPVRDAIGQSRRRLGDGDVR